MDAGTSTSTRTDEERVGGDCEGEAGATAHDSTRHLSLLDLPDELIARIHDQVHATVDKHSPHAIPASLDTLLVSKRVYKIARPVFLRSLRAPMQDEDFDAFLACIADQPVLWSAVRALAYTFAPALRQVQLTLVGRLQHLTFLRLRACRDQRMPREAIELISRHQHLDTLEFRAWQPFEDESFSLSSASPTLRVLLMQGAGYLEPLLAAGISSLKIMEMNVPASEIRAMPASLPNVESLQIDVVADDNRNAERFIGAIYDLLDNSIHTRPSSLSPLRELWLDLRTSPSSESLQEAPGARLIDMIPILRLLARLDLKHLEHIALMQLSSIDVLEQVPAFTLNSVRDLTLYTRCELSEPNVLPRLATFLRCFPSLLHLSYYTDIRQHSSQEPDRAIVLAAVDPLARALRYPHLAALFVLLRTSGVLGFAYSSIGCDGGGQARRRTSSTATIS